LVVLVFAVLASVPASTSAREAISASPPSALAVTMYRDPQRGADDEMDRRWPRGFAMITETRTVTLPPGESTVRFEGVAEGMVAVSAIVTGLPGGTIEKNRNADLLSPAALIDGTLGNRVTVTRTNPATGTAVSESAIVRTRADGGMVLQTSEGFEAVRCAGIPEKLTFDRVPAGLSAQPVFSIDTRDASGGTHTVELTYLAWGFDWQAHYVATLDEPGRGDAVGLKLMSWLTLLNDNGQSFPDAELLVVAGRLNVVSDFEALADPPEGRGLQLTCYPLGSTAAGSAEIADMAFLGAPPPPPAPIMAMAREAQDIVVTGGRIASKAQEEALGDLKLYRVSDRVTVAAQSLKQVAFLDQDKVKGRLLYEISCAPSDNQNEPQPTSILLATVNDKRHGLGMALPMGGVTVFGPSAFGAQLVAEDRVRDYAEGQDVELGLGESRQVFAQCQRPQAEGEIDNNTRWRPMRTTVSNANAEAVTIRVTLGSPVDWQVRGLRRTRIKDGMTIAEVTIPGNSRRVVTWEVRRTSDLAGK
jgi:hypothetical protein